MGDLVEISGLLARRRLEAALADAFDRLGSREAPLPESLGWTPLVTDEAGRPVRWIARGYRSTIGFVPGDPDLVYLDRDHELRVWEMTIGELAAGLETGFLPEPILVTDWKGDPIAGR